MEIINTPPAEKRVIKAVLFDFDGTISTLRHGWENIMEPMMLEMLSDGQKPDSKLIKKVKEYIDKSTGIQTIHQMSWLADEVRKRGLTHKFFDDPWWYKSEYNRRLMIPVEERMDLIKSGKKNSEDFLIKNSVDMLEFLKSRSIKMFVASGTDDADVKREAEILGVDSYFSAIAGAPAGKISCSKEAVLRELVESQGYTKGELAVIGDGKVEIMLGREVGALTLGLASDEVKRAGINETKKKRLIRAGAHAIAGDFTDINSIAKLFGL